MPHGFIRYGVLPLRADMQALRDKSKIQNEFVYSFALGCTKWETSLWGEVPVRTAETRATELKHFDRSCRTNGHETAKEAVMNTQKQTGFTLIELMIVIEIIAVLAALAIPAVARQRIQTNEAAAVGNLRTISTAEFAHNAAKLAYGSFEELAAGSGVSSGAFLDGTWRDGIVKNEYVYEMPLVNTDNFRVTARPSVVGRTGLRTFFVDASGDIKTDVGGGSGG